MSEGDPQLPPEVPEAADVKPLNYIEHDPGIFASEGDPEYVDPDSPTTVHDKDKAKAMAIAEDDDRNAAAKLRHAANALDHYGWQARGLEEDVTNLGPEPEVKAIGPFKRASQEHAKGIYRARKRQLEEERKDLDRQTQQALDRPEVAHRGFQSNMLERARAGVHDSEAEEEIDKWLEHFHGHARSADERAKERGELAGMLHDKPVSDAYKEAHPFEGAYDTVDGIVLIEHWTVPELEREVKQLHEDLEDRKDQPS